MCKCVTPQQRPGEACVQCLSMPTAGLWGHHTHRHLTTFHSIARTSAAAHGVCACMCVSAPQASLSSSSSSQPPITQFPTLYRHKGWRPGSLWLPHCLHHVTQTHTLGTGRAATAALPLHKDRGPHTGRNSRPRCQTHVCPVHRQRARQVHTSFNPPHCTPHTDTYTQQRFLLDNSHSRP